MRRRERLRRPQLHSFKRSLNQKQIWSIGMDFKSNKKLQIFLLMLVRAHLKIKLLDVSWEHSLETPWDH
jgi:hypothetical protein